MREAKRSSSTGATPRRGKPCANCSRLCRKYTVISEPGPDRQRPQRYRVSHTCARGQADAVPRLPAAAEKRMTPDLQEGERRGNDGPLPRRRWTFPSEDEQEKAQSSASLISPLQAHPWIRKGRRTGCGTVTTRATVTNACASPVQWPGVFYRSQWPVRTRAPFAER